MPLDPSKIKAAIAKLDVSQAEVARRAGMSPPALNQIVQGRRIDPNLSTAEKIADALGCSLVKLLR